MSEQIYLNSKVLYALKLRGSKATFIWSSLPSSKLKSSIDLKVKVHPSEIFWLAENLSCSRENNYIYAPDLDAYNRLVIYACTRPSIKDSEKAKYLALQVIKLNNWDAHYWASKFRELWWAHRKYRPLMKVAKSFKLFFNLE
jgi:hypothetical protein